MARSPSFPGASPGGRTTGPKAGRGVVNTTGREDDSRISFHNSMGIRQYELNPSEVACLDWNRHNFLDFPDLWCYFNMTRGLISFRGTFPQGQKFLPQP